MLDDNWVKAMRDSFEEIGDRIPTPDGSRPQVFVDVLEHKPDLVLSALQNDRLLDFCEMIVGPHIQLESITYPDARHHRTQTQTRYWVFTGTCSPSFPKKASTTDLCSCTMP